MQKKCAVLVVSSPSSEFDLLDHYINKHFSSNITRAFAANAEEAHKKINNQRFDFIIAFQNVIANNISKFAYTVSKSSLNDSTQVAILKNNAFIENTQVKNNVAIFKAPINYNKLMDLLATHLKLDEEKQYKAAKTFEAFADVCKNFSDKAFYSESEILHPIPKQKNENIFGDIAMCFNMSLGNYRSTYLLSLNQQLVDKLKVIYKPDDKQATDEIVITSILDVASNHLKNIFKNVPFNLQKNLILTRGQFNENGFKGKRAVLLPIATKYGQILIYSF